jgi:Glycosyltransferase
VSLETIETFGLAALEALACGTPVVCSERSALSEVVGEAGLAVGDDPRQWVEAVSALTPPRNYTARQRAREHAIAMPWTKTVRRMLALHGLVDRGQPDLRRSPLLVQAA